ncbi:MAG: dihydropteroate synthase [Euryarchaeota archaeon RBG_19FT_COMBO_69_17]|nr:MAG: dihydropteroate synthase [Euryarchaeota archaeon RBG_19FT_COMBO_69_17]
MGVLNVTPDSFSDGGLYDSPDAAVSRALRMVEEGADVIDLGGESTRPGADPVPADVEWSRVGPVLARLAGKLDVPISIDTRKPEIAEKALEAGASIVNDVSAFRAAGMAEVVAAVGAGAVLVHMLGEPKTMQAAPTYADVAQEVRDFLEARVKEAIGVGVEPLAIAVDPGIGFGKTVEHNVQLLRQLDVIAGLGRPIVVGVSRKSFLERLGAGGPGERLPGGIAAAAYAVLRGADVVRTHDVLETARAMRAVDALRPRP